jgi:hypothetical protein
MQQSLKTWEKVRSGGGVQDAGVQLKALLEIDHFSQVDVSVLIQEMDSVSSSLTNSLKDTINALQSKLTLALQENAQLSKQLTSIQPSCPPAPVTAPVRTNDGDAALKAKVRKLEMANTELQRHVDIGNEMSKYHFLRIL